MELFKAFWGLITKALLSNLSGLQGTIGKYILDYGGRYLYEMFEKWIKDNERKKAQEAAQVVLKEKQADPTSTVEDRAKAYEDAHNAGR